MLTDKKVKQLQCECKPSGGLIHHREGVCSIFHTFMGVMKFPPGTEHVIVEWVGDLPDDALIVESDIEEKGNCGF
jgi:hypothetical protein